MYFLYLSSSDAVDKNPPAVHTLPAAKTFSKTAAAPRNSGINPAAAFKSPTAPEQRSVHLGGQTGTRTHIQEPFSAAANVVLRHFYTTS